MSSEKLDVSIVYNSAFLSLQLKKSDTVLHAKKVIASKLKTTPDFIVLASKGQLLNDSQTLGNADIGTNGILVLLNSTTLSVQVKKGSHRVAIKINQATSVQELKMKAAEQFTTLAQSENPNSPAVLWYNLNLINAGKTLENHQFAGEHNLFEATEILAVTEPAPSLVLPQSFVSPSSAPPPLMQQPQSQQFFTESSSASSSSAAPSLFSSRSFVSSSSSSSFPQSTRASQSFTTTPVQASSQSFNKQAQLFTIKVSDGSENRPMEVTMLDTDTVADLKRKVAEIKEMKDPADLMIIHADAGKMLEDHEKLIVIRNSREGVTAIKMQSVEWPKNNNQNSSNVGHAAGQNAKNYVLLQSIVPNKGSVTEGIISQTFFTTKKAALKAFKKMQELNSRRLNATGFTVNFKKYDNWPTWDLVTSNKEPIPTIIQFEKNIFFYGVKDKSPTLQHISTSADQWFKLVSWNNLNWKIKKPELIISKNKTADMFALLSPHVDNSHENSDGSIKLRLKKINNEQELRDVLLSVTPPPLLIKCCDPLQYFVMSHDSQKNKVITQIQSPIFDNPNYVNLSNAYNQLSGIDFTEDTSVYTSPVEQPNFFEKISSYHKHAYSVYKHETLYMSYVTFDPDQNPGIDQSDAYIDHAYSDPKEFQVGTKAEVVGFGPKVDSDGFYPGTGTIPTIKYNTVAYEKEGVNVLFRPLNEQGNKNDTEFTKFFDKFSWKTSESTHDMQLAKTFMSPSVLTRYAVDENDADQKAFKAKEKQEDRITYKEDLEARTFSFYVYGPVVGASFEKFANEIMKNAPGLIVCHRPAVNSKNQEIGTEFLFDEEAFRNQNEKHEFLNQFRHLLRDFQYEPEIDNVAVLPNSGRKMSYLTYSFAGKIVSETIMKSILERFMNLLKLYSDKNPKFSNVSSAHPSFVSRTPANSRASVPSNFSTSTLHTSGLSAFAPNTSASSISSNRMQQFSNSNSSNFNSSNVQFPPPKVSLLQPDVKSRSEVLDKLETAYLVSGDNNVYNRNIILLLKTARIKAPHWNAVMCVVCMFFIKPENQQYYTQNMFDAFCKAFSISSNQALKRLLEDNKTALYNALNISEKDSDLKQKFNLMIFRPLAAILTAKSYDTNAATAVFTQLDEIITNTQLSASQSTAQKPKNSLCEFQ